MTARRSRLWLRWSVRDLRGRWALVLAIGLVIAIGTGVNAGLGSMEDWRVASNDASYAALRAHDVEVSLTEGTSAQPGSLAELARRIPAAGGIAATEERLRLPTQVEIRPPGEEPLLVPAEIVGSPLGPRGPRVDAVYAESGRTLRAAEEGRPVAVLERNFGEFHDLPASGAIRLSGGHRLRYVGLGGSPEYFLVTRPGGGNFGGAEAQFAALFTSLRTAQGIAGKAVVNDLVLRLDPGASPAAVRRQLERSLRAAGLSGEATTLAEEAAHRVLYKDASGDQEMFDIFGFLILAGAALAAFNLATRIVEAQRREIGIGMALGVPPRQLAIRPLLLGVQIAVTGTLFGLVLGLLMGDIFRGVLEDLLPLPVMRTPFELGVFLRAAALGLVLPLAATAIPVWRGLRQTPVRAIRVGFRSARGSGLAGLVRRLRLPGSSVSQLPLRNVMRAPRRTALTVLGLGAVLSVLVSFLGMIDSFVATVDRSEAEVAKDNPARITVTLSGFEPDARALRATRVPGVARAEPRLALPARLASSGGRGFDASLTLLDFRSQIWTPTIVSGAAPESGQPGIVISEKAAEDLGVSVGEPVTIAYPQRQGGRLVERRAELPVAGLDPDPFRTFAYIDRSLAALAGFGGIANQVAITPRPGFSEERIARALFRSKQVAGVEEATATTKFVRERIDDFIGVLQLIEGFALALALLIAFNSSSISIDERRRENATMLAFGVSAPRAVRLAVFESVVTGLLGILTGIAGGYLLLSYVVNNTVPDTLPDLKVLTQIAPGSALAAAAVALFAVALAPLLSARRIARMDIPSTLRVME
ncbi:MAG TPA: FtsX-like permease family protein [Solirubrobacterales bacterium]|nr:FtsX-like permease family protein [Solirubrobacterales bacterium]